MKTLCPICDRSLNKLDGLFVPLSVAMIGAKKVVNGQLQYEFHTIPMETS